MSRSKWVAPALWGTFIEVLTSWPHVPDFGEPAGSDKVVHFSMYAIFAALVMRAAQPPKTALRVASLVLIALVAWAAVDEWHQLFIPGRSADVADWTADSVGVAAGIAFAWARQRRLSLDQA